MNNTNNFYDELELHDTEIAIAMDDIDRTKPEKIKFIIPVLTPYMDNSKIAENTIHQNKENLMNADASSIEINNLQNTNYFIASIPKELCAISDGEFEITEGELNTTNDISSSNGSISMSGSINEETGSISVSGNININTANIKTTKITGTLKVRPKDRIIKAPSKWAVTFIGGDISKPRIICRLLD